MGFIPDGFGQATLVFEIPGPGGPAMVVFGVADNEANTPDANAALIGSHWSATDSMQDGQDQSCILRESRLLVRRSGNLQAGIDFPDTAGALAGTGAPPQVAFLFQKLTGFAGRNRRGRLYLPGAPSSPEDGIFPAATVTLMQGRADTFMTALASASLDMMLLHVSEVDPPNAVTELSAQGLSATQRRRLR
jgi:hypothetical protein